MPSFFLFIVLMSLRISILILFIAGCGLQAHGQETPRTSVAGLASAEGQKGSMEDTHYNFKVGPAAISLRAGSSVEFNDNINLAHVGKQSDIILRPELGVNARWQVSTLNTLTFDTTLGYSKYLSHSENDTKYLLASPGSALEFFMYIGDFRLNFHDRFAYSQDPIQVSVVSNTAQFGRFTNSIGPSVDWDLNDVVLTLGYDYNTFLATTQQFSYLDSDGHTFTGKASFIVNPTIKAGLQATTTITQYKQNFQNNSGVTSIGPFVEADLTDNTKITSGVGLQLGQFDSGGGNGDSSNLNGFYANVMVTNKLNKYFSQSLSLGHDSELGVTSNFYTTDYIRHTANWNIINHVSLGSQLFFEHIVESGGVVDETLNRFGAGITAGYQITQKLTSTVGYTYTQKVSNSSLLDYIQNSLVLTLSYQF
jgi:hypothetical protein